MIFGQIVIGPPGSGKTSYCKAMKDFMRGLKRQVKIINLDPANDVLPYKCFADVSDLITVEDVMKFKKRGPNGGLVYCLEYLEDNMEWLLEKLDKLKPTDYVLFDCPGQVELYVHHTSVRNIFKTLTRGNRFSICAVHLVDSLLCTDPSSFISALMISLSAMIRVELPHVNVLTKVDLIEKYGSLPFNLQFFTEVLDLNCLLECMKENKFTEKTKKISSALIRVVEDFGLVSFVPLHIKDDPSMLHLLKKIDKANGYIYGTDEEKRVENFMKSPLSLEFQDCVTTLLQEKFIDSTTKEVKFDSEAI